MTGTKKILSSAMPICFRVATETGDWLAQKSDKKTNTVNQITPA